MTRYCPSPLCGLPLVRREGESPSSFRDRIHCNTVCSRESLNARNRAKRQPSRRLTCSRCEEMFTQKRAETICAPCRAKARKPAARPKESSLISPVDTLAGLSRRACLEIETELMPHLRASLGL